MFARFSKSFYRSRGVDWASYTAFIAPPVAAMSSIFAASPTNDKKGDKQYPFIVVGGGTAGCVVSRELARHMAETGIPGKVLLLEAGSSPVEGNTSPYLKDWYHRFGSYGETYETTFEGRHDYPVQPIAHIGLGGCSQHHTAIAFGISDEQRKAFAHDTGTSTAMYNTFEQLVWDNKIISDVTPEPFVDDVLSCWETQNYMSFFHPDHNEPSSVTGSMPAPLPQLAAAKTKKSRLANRYSRFRGRIAVGAAGYCAFAMTPEEVLVSSFDTISPFNSDAPSNIEIVTGAKVDKILTTTGDMDRRVATGVVADVNGQKVTYQIPRYGEVVVASGTFNAPAVLQRSGIGPPRLLKRLGVPVLIPNEHVGRGVDHTEVLLQWTIHPEHLQHTRPTGGATSWPCVGYFSVYSLNQRGWWGTLLRKLSSIYGCRGLIRAVFGARTVCQFHFGISGPPYDDGEPSLCLTPNVATPDEAAGFSVAIQSSDPRIPVKVTYHDAPADYDVLLEACKHVQRLGETLVDGGLLEKQIAPPPGTSAEEWIGGASLRGPGVGTPYHWMCTTRAGAHAAVADEYNIVRGTSNIRVAGANALPHCPYGNLHVPVETIACRVAFDIVRVAALRLDVPFTPSKHLAAAALRVNLEGAGRSRVRQWDDALPALKRSVVLRKERYEAKKRRDE